MPLAPPPFDGQVFNTFEECITAIQAHCKSEGYAVVIERGSNPRDNEYTRYDLACDRGRNKQTVRSVGIRPNAGSIKNECPFRAKVVKRVLLGDQWQYETREPSHNHEPSHEPTAHAIHRQRYDEAISTISRLSTAGATPRAIHREVSAATNTNILRRDIYNDRASIRRQEDGPYTATQRFLQVLKDSEFYNVCHDDGRIIGAFWTFPWCMEMWKKYPSILSMDNIYKVSTLYLRYIFLHSVGLIK